MTELSVAGFENNFLIRSSVKANSSPTKVAWYNRKYVVALWHTLAWIAIFALPFLIRTSNNDSHRPPFEIGFLYFYIVTRFFWVGFFYFNALYLFPKFILQKKYLLYVGSQFLSLFILSIIHSIWFNIFVKNAPYEVLNFLVFNLFAYLFILAASIAYKMVIDKIKTDKLLQEKENENLKTELSFLRSQVSPHFMFNVLNNMVALARKNLNSLSLH